MDSPIREAQRYGQSIWYDNISRGLLISGELGRLVDQGITGVTSNPTIFEKAVASGIDYDDDLVKFEGTRASVQEVYESIAIQDIRDATDLLYPVYERTKSLDGYVSLEVSPFLANDTDGTVIEAERLFKAVGRPNLMIKVPGTTEGIPAIRSLIGKGINVNVTLIFSLESYKMIQEAYIDGLEDLDRSGKYLGNVASVASFFVSRVDTAVDTLINKYIAEGSGYLEDYLGKAANSNAKLAYQSFKETFQSKRFTSLMVKGAQIQRPLWASTGTKNSAYSDLAYIEPLIGLNTVNTMPPNTLEAFQNHGRVAPTIEQNVEEAKDTFEVLGKVGIRMEEVTGKLLIEGVNSFAESFGNLLTNIDQKKTKLVSLNSI